jgi:hypothetical protein
MGVYRLTTTVILEKQSRTSKAEAGASTHILPLNCGGQRLTTTCYSKETSKQFKLVAVVFAMRTPVTYNIIDEKAVNMDGLV